MEVATVPHEQNRITKRIPCHLACRPKRAGVRFTFDRAFRSEADRVANASSVVIAP